MLTHLKSALVMASLSLAGALALVGCVADTNGSEDSQSHEDEATHNAVGEPTAEAAGAVQFGWTQETSDELPPIACDSGALITHVKCTGRYCDNISMFCQADGHGT